MSVRVRPFTGSARSSKIDEVGRARRKAAVDYAKGSLRLDGFEISEFATQLDRQYVAGEITRAEKTAALLAHYQR